MAYWWDFHLLSVISPFTDHSKLLAKTDFSDMLWIIFISHYCALLVYFILTLLSPSRDVMWRYLAPCMICLSLNHGWLIIFSLLSLISITFHCDLIALHLANQYYSALTLPKTGTNVLMCYIHYHVIWYACSRWPIIVAYIE